MNTPLYILSLPRSGSTLLQKVLALHPEIETASEPWILLPLLYALRRSGAVAEYSHGNAVRGIEDFLGDIGGTDRYLADIGALVRSMYEDKACSRSAYFLDKTPRYYLIADDIAKMYPDAKFLVLFRNPLAVVSSMANTWQGGRWQLRNWLDDLTKGPRCLVSFAENHPSHCFCVNYEHFVANPESSLKQIMYFLNLNMDSIQMDTFSSVNLKGAMGDPTGQTKYNNISKTSMNQWKNAFQSPLRRLWARRYLAHLGDPMLETMGYNADIIGSDLPASISMKQVLFDCIDMPYSTLIHRVKMYVFSR